MAYVQQEDFSRVIGNEELTELLEEAAALFPGKTNEQVLSESALMAQNKINQFLGERFQMAVEFAKEATTVPDTRDVNILRCYLHLSVYWLNFAINPRDIPELRQKAFDQCIKELTQIRDGALFLDIPVVADSTPPIAAWSGHRKFISKPFRDPLVQDEQNPIP